VSYATASVAVGESRSVATVDTGAVSAALVCILLFLILNPFLALFVLAIINFFRRIPAVPFILSASLAFTLFFFFRDYGVEWYFNSSDDVPTYIGLYETNATLSFGDLFTNFIEAPNGYELLWHLPWWFLMNTFHASDDTFVFLHYLVLFLGVFLSLLTLSREQLVPSVVVYFLLTPISLDAVAHVWRQQLACSVFLAGAGLHIVRGSRAGKWLIWAAPLVHVSFTFFLMLFLLFELIRARRGFDNKLKVSIFLALLLGLVPVIAKVAIFFLDSIGLARIMSYFEGYDTDVTRAYLIIAAYIVPMLLSFYLFRSDDLNHLFVVLCFAVFSIVLALPGSNSIYERLFMSVLPMWGLFLVRTLRANFRPAWYFAAVVASFLIGVLRLQTLASDGQGLGAFLAYGHAFDPLMGTIKMVSTL
jgi:hypothetical protein